MRVISGTARSLKLETIDSLDTRPTTDRIKETLFNMINVLMPGCRFLDLFAGSRAIGIEALSRGAAGACFVENSRKAVACIERNLEFTNLGENAVVYKRDAVGVIDLLESKGLVFDVIFMDPPYGKLLEKRVLLSLSASGIVGVDTVVIVESDIYTEFDYLYDAGFEVYKSKVYKTNKHTFIRRRLI